MEFYVYRFTDLISKEVYDFSFTPLIKFLNMRYWHSNHPFSDKVFNNRVRSIAKLSNRKVFLDHEFYYSVILIFGG